MAERIVRDDLSVRSVEELARKGRAPSPRRRSNPRKTAQVRNLESELRGHLGTKVQIQDRRGKGRILIEYYSPEDFERILDVIRGADRGFSVTEVPVREEPFRN